MSPHLYKKRKGGPSTCSGVDGAPSGFLATYGYNALNNLTSAKVGAHSGYSGQNRSFFL